MTVNCSQETTSRADSEQSTTVTIIPTLISPALCHPKVQSKEPVSSSSIQKFYKKPGQLKLLIGSKDELG